MAVWPTARGYGGGSGCKVLRSREGGEVRSGVVIGTIVRVVPTLQVGYICPPRYDAGQPVVVLRVPVGAVESAGVAATRAPRIFAHQTRPTELARTMTSLL